MSRADQRVLRWVGHLERMDEYRIARRALMADVSGRRVRGKQRLGCMDDMKMALGSRGMTVEAARQCAKGPLAPREGWPHVTALSPREGWPHVTLSPREGWDAVT